MAEDSVRRFRVTKEDEGERLDRYLVEELSGYSRNFIQHIISQKAVLVNDNPSSNNYKVRKGDKIRAVMPSAIQHQAIPEKIPVKIIYSDRDIIIVNKNPGMVVHPAAGNMSGTLLNALLYKYPDLNNLSGKVDVHRLGIVHRLDRDTSGVMVVARNEEAMSEIAKQFEKRVVQKEYHAIVKGRILNPEGTIEAPIGRKSDDRKKMAVSSIKSRKSTSIFRVIEHLGPCTLVEVKPRTGRTHQIRVHLAYIGFPVLGDSQYCAPAEGFNAPRQMLHAYKIGFIHPTTREWVSFAAPLPKDFLDVMERLKQGF